MNRIPVEKNEEEELPIPLIWRHTLKSIVNAFVIKDYKLIESIDKVSPISNDTAKQIENYIKDYGEELISLPEETWNSSRYIYCGNYWNILIDLYTENEGISDLCLNVEVKEEKDTYSFDNTSVKFK